MNPRYEWTAPPLTKPPLPGLDPAPGTLAPAAQPVPPSQLPRDVTAAPTVPQIEAKWRGLKLGASVGGFNMGAGWTLTYDDPATRCTPKRVVYATLWLPGAGTQQESPDDWDRDPLSAPEAQALTHRLWTQLERHQAGTPIETLAETRRRLGPEDPHLAALDDWLWAQLRVVLEHAEARHGLRDVEPTEVPIYLRP